MIEERIPIGSTVVLINQANKDTDIYLPINADEKQLVDAIDGNQTIQQIIESVNPNNSQKYCFVKAQVIDLFLRLWRYDQVVFATSTASSQC